MSNLDKAIRARLQAVRVHMGEHRNAQFDDGVDPLFNDAGELGAAVLAVLDRHVHTGDDNWYIGPKVLWSCSQCGSLADRWCDEVLAIATSLGVSGEDRSEPTPAPRRWSKGDPEPLDAPLLEDPNGDRLARRTDGLWGWVRIDGRHVHDVVPSPWHNLAVWRDATPEQAAGYWLSEVVTPEGPA